MPIVGSGIQIIELVDNQEFFGQEVINRYWYYLNSTSTVDVAALAATFITNVVDAMRVIQSDQLNHLTVDVINHTDLASFGSFVTGTAGIRTPTEIMPPFVAVGIRLLRTTRDMRNGFKRIAGMTEDIQNEGLFTAGFLTTVATQATGISATLTESIRNYQPVIIRNRPTNHDPLIDPLDTATWRYTFVSGTAVKNAVTTQNSRKY